MDYLLIIIGAILGCAIGYLLGKNKYKQQDDLSIDTKLLEEKSKLEERNNLLENSNAELKQEIDKSRESNTSLSNENSKLKVINDNLQEKIDENKEEFLKIQENFKDEFKNLANEILDDKSKKFSDHNKEVVQNLLNPLGAKINDFQKRINDIHKEDVEGRATLYEQLNSLKDLNKQMSKDADNLTKALKGESKTQGTWGEFILESVLEKSGLVKGEQYKVQKSFVSEDGKRQQPDVIVYLPEGKNIIIDSKVSLVAYERFTSSDDEDERKKYITDHIKSIEKHFKDLSEKKYQNIYDLNTPDFVLMFIPIEPAFATAVQFSQKLFYDAFDKNIVIVSPSTLLATLRTIESIWRQENQNKNAMEIARQSGALYDKFVGFVENLISIGKKLDSTKDEYNSAMNKLYDGSGNIVRRVEKLKELGAKTTKNIQTNLLEKSDD